MRTVHGNGLATAPAEPNEEESGEIDEFLKVLLKNFQAAIVFNFQYPTDFKYDPRESLYMLGTGFYLIALALEGNNLMSSQSLALSLLQHLPEIVRARVEYKIRIHDEGNLDKEEPFSDRGELMSTACKDESADLRRDAEFQIAGMKPPPRTRASGQYPLRSPIHDRLSCPSSMANRPGARVPERRETRACNHNHLVGHIASVHN